MSEPRILIVDDEALARRKIRRFLGELGVADENIRDAVNGLDGLLVLEEFSPEIIFLDIEMPGLNGFEMLAQIEKRPFKIIFQTAFDEFAVRAFEEAACDYLLKPFDRERFARSYRRAEEGLERLSDLSLVEEKLRAQKHSYLERLTIRQGGQLRIIECEDVICFVSRDHYTCVYTQVGEFVTELSLIHLEERLNPEIFMRIHRKNIVRKKCVKSVVGGENMKVELRNGEQLAVSRNHRKALLDSISIR